MIKPHPAILRLDAALRKRFEDAWACGAGVAVEQLLPQAEDPAYLPTLLGLVCLEMELSWQKWRLERQHAETIAPDQTAFHPPMLEAYLRRFPVLEAGETLSQLARHEFRLRRTLGDAVQPEEYARRFPQLGARWDASGPDEPMQPTPQGSSAASETIDELPAVASSQSDMQPGRFGHYELIEEIGRGGMGIVYRARQQAADRIVALKVIRRDRLDSLPRDTQASTIGRFRHEAQAAARLEHDNIVTVYEVGEIEGQPFFSMRLVDGQSLSEIVRQGPLENRRAAALIEPVARAVAHAHSLGILHRDLKPQNILVDRKTDRPMVADFGLAKLAEHGDELTRAGEVMGTPSYMSPEQARDAAGVTAATDIYALGATLYCLLTGRPPFYAANAVETLRQVIHQEPAAPRQLNPSIDRDLETICLKCLEKEPGRRYPTADALADDLRRYLEGRPIVARPIGRAARLWRWCRRNPVTASLVATSLTFLLAALAGTSTGMVLASIARQRAEQSYQHARTTVDNFCTRVAEDTLLNQPGMQELRKRLLEDAVRYYRWFLSQRADDPTLRDEVARAQFRQGRIIELIDSPKAALDSYEQARRLQEELLAANPDDLARFHALSDTMNAIGRVLHIQQNLPAARQAYQRAVELRQRLVDRDRDNVEYQRALANSYMNIGLLEQDLGHAEPAVWHFETAQRMRLAVLARAGRHLELQRDLGKGYFNRAALELGRGNLAAAQAQFELAARAFEQLLEYESHDLDAQYRLALSYRSLTDLELMAPQDAADSQGAAGSQSVRRAVEFSEKAVRPLLTLALANPLVAVYRAQLAGLLISRAVAQRQAGQPDVARSTLDQAVQLYEELRAEYPDVADYADNLVIARLHRSGLARELSDPQAALGDLSAAADTLRGLIQVHPGQLRYHTDYAVVLKELAGAEQQLGHLRLARRNLEMLLAYVRKLLEQHPDTDPLQRVLAEAEAALADLQLLVDRADN